MKLVHQLPPGPDNGRNSEGSFIRLDDGRILFAYSRYNTPSGHDHAACDIAAIYSSDEGETWTEPRLIAKAVDLDAANLMSVSCVRQLDGRVGVYFIIKERGLTSTMGRALSADGETFEVSRCVYKFPTNYYVINNDRLIRLPDGRLLCPASRHAYGTGPDGGPACDGFAVSVVFVSEDDGATWRLLPFRLTLSATRPGDVGMQEPGLFRFKDGTLWLWARTAAGGQYESFSRDDLGSFTVPQPSVFTGPTSPLEVARNPATDVIYAVYNPISNYPGRPGTDPSWGRTPFVVRKSADEGRTWSNPVVIEDDPVRGYCYPALFFTKDDALLLAYCRGANGGVLNTLGIAKIPLADI
ncbi:MAG: exo-alpha-sialidase [Kiritimatiellae bacterium]|nr:exo-alpha-sialidase [Kiritimatiellia bacterium]